MPVLYHIRLGWDRGKSAGAVNAFSAVYFSQDQRSDLTPNIENLLGTIDTSGNTLNTEYDIQGIYNNWGATILEYMQNLELVPSLLFVVHQIQYSLSTAVKLLVFPVQG